MEHMLHNTSMSVRQEREEWLSAYERTRLELERSFSHDRFNIIRKELFAHRNDAACTIRPDGITFNQSCINGLKDVVYILISLDEHGRRLLVEPCTEDTPHCLRWCVVNGTKRKSRKLTGKDFGDLIYKKMSWDKSIRYKALGFRIEIENGVLAYVFKLDTPEMFDIPPIAKKKGESNGSTREGQQGASARRVSEGRFGEDLISNYGLSHEQYKRETAVIEKDGFVQLAMLTGRQEAGHGQS